MRTWCIKQRYRPSVNLAQTRIKFVGHYSYRNNAPIRRHAVERSRLRGPYANDSAGQIWFRRALAGTQSTDDRRDVQHYHRHKHQHPDDVNVSQCCRLKCRLSIFLKYLEKYAMSKKYEIGGSSDIIYK